MSFAETLIVNFHISKLLEQSIWKNGIGTIFSKIHVHVSH